jgi:hypothetical protein
MSGQPPLTATLEPAPEAGPGQEFAVVLRLVNAASSTVEVLNPDLGRPSSQMRWPWSDEVYRAALMVSYGYLKIAVYDPDGEPLDREAVETWATPVLRPPVVLQPGDALEVTIPVGRFFHLAPRTRYRISAEYGDRSAKARAEASLEVA